MIHVSKCMNKQIHKQCVQENVAFVGAFHTTCHIFPQRVYQSSNNIVIYKQRWCTLTGQQNAIWENFAWFKSLHSQWTNYSQNIWNLQNKIVYFFTNMYGVFHYYHDTPKAPLKFITEERKTSNKFYGNATQKTICCDSRYYLLPAYASSLFL